MNLEVLSAPEYFRDHNGELDEILNTPLSPDTIETYATDALEKLITLTDDVVSAYSQLPVHAHESMARQEDAALAYFELPDMNTILDHVSDLATEIKELDQVIDRATAVDYITVPSDPHDNPTIKTGNGSYEPTRTRALTKTVTLILAHNFDIDVNDPQQLRITKGLIADSMVRNDGYYLLEAPDIARAILACDEVGNATYVFDTDAAANIDLDGAAISRLTKQQLSELLSTHPQLGTRLIQSAQFVGRLTEALQTITVADSESNDNHQIEQSLLRPKDTPAAQTATSMAREWNISKVTVAKAVQALGDSLGDVMTFQHAGQTVNGFNTEQRELIQEHLRDSGMFSDKAPDDYRSVTRFAKELKLTNETVRACMAEIGDELGDIGVYKIGAYITQGLSPEQQSALKQALHANGALPERPNTDVLSILGMAQAWGIQHATVTRATRDLQHNLGIVDQYKFGPKFTAGYNHAQQAEIRNYLAEQGYLNETSDGIRSITSLAVEWNMSRGTLAKVVQTAQAETDDFGEVGHYRTGSVPTSCLTDAQQSKVRAELEKRGLLNNETPEGVESLRSLIDNLETSYPRATALLDRLVKDGVIDEPAQYRFGSQFGIGLTAQQRAIVTKVMLEENAQIAPPPPEGVLSFKGLAEAMQVEYRGIRRAYNQLAEAGAVSADTYTFSRVQTVGLDKDAQRIVARELAERGAQQGVRTKAANFLQQLLAGQRPD